MGRRYRSWREPTVQRAIAETLDASPMPWTFGMLQAWIPTMVGSRSIIMAAETMRIWRIERGMYASAKYRPRKWPVAHPARRATMSPRGPNDVITDDMLARFGFNL
jgi:hypothetical protein